MKSLFGWVAGMRQGTSRRHNRLWMMRLKKFGIASVVGGCFIGALSYAYSMGAFSTAGDWAHQKTLGLTSNAGFKVENILVTGRNRIAPEELLEKLNIREDDAIFGIDIASTQTELRTLPWVKEVHIARRLPATIAINIQERVPVALWQHQKKISAIDIDGVPLTSIDLEKYRTLPLVVGSNAQKNVGELLSFLQAEPAITEHFSSAVRIGERRWDLHLDNGIIVKLPEKDTELALSRLGKEAAKENILNKNIRVIDLRTPEKLVVELGESATEKKTAKTNI